jgi:hypothetical protein
MKASRIVAALLIAAGMVISIQPAATAAAVPVSKVMVIIEENHSLDQMKTGMPYLYSQAVRYGHATNYTAITHPSLPNYLAIAAGDTFGVTDDSAPSVHPIAGKTALGEALAKGLKVRSYAESMTTNCSLTSFGAYAVKHNPWAYFTDERAACNSYDKSSGTVSAGNMRTTIASGALAKITLVTPNLCNDAHDCSLATADIWFRNWMTLIYASPDWKTGKLAVVVTADEDNGSQNNTVLTTVIHPSQSGHVVKTRLTHYSLTRLLTDIAHAPCLRNGCTAPNMATAFGLPIG